MGLLKIQEAINTWIITDPEMEACMELFHSLPPHKQQMVMNLTRTLAKDEATKKDKLVQLHVIK